jgi:hypothetical protein
MSNVSAMVETRARVAPVARAGNDARERTRLSSA